MFDPLSIKNDIYEPLVCLTNLKVNNTLVTDHGSNTSLPSPLNSLSKLVFPFSDNTIAIGFAGLQFNQPQDLIYRCQLKGYDDGWIAAGHSPNAAYTKVPPGSYTLLLNASNTNGKWSDHIKSVVISVRPPWWRTWWAYVCCAIALLALIWGYILSMISYFMFAFILKSQHYQLASISKGFYLTNQLTAITFIFYGLFLIKKENSQYQNGILAKNKEIKDHAQALAAQTVELTELNTIKNKLFSVIGHDLKTPVYSMRNLFQNIEQQKLSAKEIKSMVPDVIDNLNYTSDLLKNLLQWAKSQM